MTGLAPKSADLIAAFDAPYGAPTAGPPPYHPYEITPVTVFGFGTADEYAGRTTRYRF